MINRVRNVVFIFPDLVLVYGRLVLVCGCWVARVVEREKDLEGEIRREEEGKINRGDGNQRWFIVDHCPVFWPCVLVE